MKLLLLVALISSVVFADNLDKICGTDQRVLSKDPKIGRTNKGCTITMISRSCALTAGHCVKNFESAEFNVPESIKGVPQPSEAKDRYFIDQKTLRFQRNAYGSSAGQDWAIVRLKPNQETGLYAGDVQGYYPIKSFTPKSGDIVRITGYGQDEDKIKGMSGNYAQQSSTGEVIGLKSKNTKSSWGGTSASYSLITYNVDTMPGSSGSVIVLEKTGEVIGIHTYGQCSNTGSGKPVGSNGGTLIANKPDLQTAIEICLNSEKED